MLFVPRKMDGVDHIVSRRFPEASLR